MGILFGLLLIVLGGLAAQDYLNEKAPPLKPALAAVNPYAQYIGLTCLLMGIIGLLQSLSILRYVGSHPLMVLVALAVSLLTLTLGLMLGLPLVHKVMNEPTPAFLVKVDKWVAGMAPHRKQLGLAAIALGILSILV